MPVNHTKEYLIFVQTGVVFLQFLARTSNGRRYSYFENWCLKMKSIGLYHTYILLAQGPSGPDLAPRMRKVPARKSPDSSEPILFDTWNHLEPLETTWSLIWGVLSTLVNFCQFGDFLSFWQLFAQSGSTIWPHQLHWSWLNFTQ